jgi:hypothetical protein
MPFFLIASRPEMRHFETVFDGLPSIRSSCASCRQGKEKNMPKFIIERELPGAGSLSAQDLQNISQSSCAILNDMGPRIQWLESFVTADKIYCVYIAPDENAIREHAQKGGFPANSIARVTTVIGPTTAED